MARHPLAILLGLLALAALGECLVCEVCIPSLKTSGATPESLKQATQLRAEISRTFPNLAESDIQVCGENTQDKTNSAGCPWTTSDVVCMGINHGDWMARTCSRIDVMADLSCIEKSGANFCPCTFDYCNKMTQDDHNNLGSGSQTVSATPATVLLVSALLGVAQGSLVSASAW